MSKNQIFEVDIAGLRQLQASKPKWFIIRELLQNAMDEPVFEIKLSLSYSYGTAIIVVEDDSPIGFRDLADAYTLFKDTYKRADATKRGRFNFGEKQVICMADYAIIESTTGGLEFDLKAGIKKTLRIKRDKGSRVEVHVKMKSDEFRECLTFAKQMKPSQGMNIEMLGDHSPGILPHVNPDKTFSAILTTELKIDDEMKKRNRECEVYLYKEGTSYLYEMGIPVCEIDCDYSIDVQQRVPLSNDRDTVPQSYLRTLYGEVLNQTYEELTKENVSQVWVREGTISDRSCKEAVQQVVTTRFGDKALIANPFDKRSMDEAISNNYNVIYSSEMSGEEWGKIKSMELLESTSSKFKTGVADGKMLKRNEVSEAKWKVATLAQRIALDMLTINLTVQFYESPDATVKADYNPESSTLRFNLSHFHDPDFWEQSIDFPYVRQDMLDLIIHELGHSRGWHYEHSYHECITELGAKCTLMALKNNNYFKL